MHSADELIDGILSCSQIPPGKRRREIQRELRTHIEDFVVAAREAGYGQDEIEKLALAHFGDPGQIARGFAWVYRHERRRLRVFAYALSTVLLASSLFAGILAIQAGLALGFGTPLTTVFASRHTAMQALDILASVGAYLGLISLEGLFKSHPFQKAVFLLMAIIAMLVVACGAAGLHITFLIFGLVNGVFFRTVQRFVAPKVARAGIVAVCFLLAGFISALVWSPGSHIYLVASCASWLSMGAGYLLMSDLAARVDRALLNGL
ncbi:MAG: permease prefix domain 1-containing protein [Bryobacteraceae bacterium]